MLRRLQLVLITLRLLPALCHGRGGAHCQDSLSGDEVCPLLAPEETMQTPGTAMLQAQHQKLLKRHLSESSPSHAKHNATEDSDAWSAAQRALEQHAAQRQGRAQHSLGQHQHKVKARHSSVQHRMRRLNETQRRHAGFDTEDVFLEKTGIAVVIPGLGSAERALTVEKNIQWLKTQDVPFDCWLYVYRTEEELPLDEARFAPCKMIRHPGYWLAHMKEMPLKDSAKPWVLHMEESTEVSPDVNLTRVFEIMTANRLGHAAPTFDTVKTPNPYGCEPPCGCCGSLYPVLAQQAKEGCPGRFVDFIELHIDVFSRSYFSCFQDNIDTSDVNMLHGWGMDRLLPALCGGAIGGSEVDAGRVGVLDHMTMEKMSHGSYSPWEAFQGMTAFLSRHPNTVQASLQTLGELVLPGQVEVKLD